MERFLRELQEIYINKGIGGRIRYLRKFRNLTIKQAAEMSITTEKCWSDWENGKAIPRDKNREIIALTLNVSQDLIFGKLEAYVFDHTEEMPSQKYTAINDTLDKVFK